MKIEMTISPTHRQPRFIRQERYAEYLKSDHWQQLRLAKLNQSGWKCEQCGETHPLDVHHKTYRKSWFDTELFELQVLCKECHKEAHAPKIKLAPGAYHPVKRKKRSKARNKAKRQLMASRRGRYDWTV